jgi:DNA replication and repair protein RecF
VEIHRLWLVGFRSHETVDIELDPGVNLVVGSNGAGKTNLVEAIGYLGSLRSFRGVPADALIRRGADQAVVRAEIDHAGRRQLVEIEIAARGRGRVQVNRQRVSRTRDLLEVVQTTVFGPDDLAIVKDGPGIRRDLLDDLIVQLRPADDVVRSDWERALRQRNSFLKQVKGRLDESAALTLEVWDTKAAEAGERLTERRADLVTRLGPFVTEAYADLAGSPTPVEVQLVSPWRAEGLAPAFRAGRDDDLRRGITLIGPHRDDVVVTLDGLPSRTHASQGEQRCLALALRLAGHRLVTEVRGDPPMLILDDVFSELDHTRAAALLEALPPGQTFITAATGAPPGVEPARTIRVERGGGVAADPI